jgi:cell division protein FtsB
MSEPTQEQIQNHARAVQVTPDDLAARVGLLTVQQEKIMSELNRHLANFNDAQAAVERLTAENTKLKAQVETLQAAQTYLAKAGDGSTSPVSETATA